MSITDLGSLPFSRAHVPTAILIWQRRSMTNGFPLNKLSHQDWVEACDGNDTIITDSIKSAKIFIVNYDGDIEPAALITGTKNKSGFIKSLGDVAVLREGSHAVKAIGKDCQRIKSDTNYFPVIIDKTMGSLISPETGYVTKPAKSELWDQHSGERFFIRKTGDRLIVAPCVSNDFALAHQNVYVGKIKHDSISFLALVGILSSSILTEIYRSGPGGQHRRPHAQLRILFLNQLPIVTIPHNKLNNSQESIVRKIATCHADIASITGKIIEAQDNNLRELLDKNSL